MAELQACLDNVEIFADLDGKHASDSPPATIPPALLVCPDQPDIVVYNEELKTVSLLELTCPFNYHTDHLTAVRQRKEGKPEYKQVAELDRLGFMSQYYTVEIGCLGHYLNETITTMKNISKQSFSHSKIVLDRAAVIAVPREYSLPAATRLELINFFNCFFLFVCLLVGCGHLKN